MKQHTNPRLQEFRQDLLSQEWVMMSANRINRPNHYRVIRPDSTTNISQVINPFLPIVTEKEHDEEVLLVVRDSSKKGVVYVVPNAYPAVVDSISSSPVSEGPYIGHTAHGCHELFIYKDPELPVRDFSIQKIDMMFEAFQKRSLERMHQKSIKYIFIFHNHGQNAGATISHPHSQLIASPIIPDGIERMLLGAKKYFNAHKKSLFAVVVDYERKLQKRVIFENEDMLVVCPYASRVAFEVEIIPKEHLPQFAFIIPSVRKNLAKAYQFVLKSYYRSLGDVDYNMYLFTAPCTGRTYEYFRWFVRLSPRIHYLGGYETGADTDVCTVFPEQAAEILRTS